MRAIPAPQRGTRCGPACFLPSAKRSLQPIAGATTRCGSPTKDEAISYAYNLLMCHFLVRATRVVETNDPINYARAANTPEFYGPKSCLICRLVD